MRHEYAVTKQACCDLVLRMAGTLICRRTEKRNSYCCLELRYAWLFSVRSAWAIGAAIVLVSSRIASPPGVLLSALPLLLYLEPYGSFVLGRRGSRRGSGRGDLIHLAARSMEGMCAIG